MIKITLISALFWGLLSSFLANRQKRNPYLWFLIGFLFGAIGLGILFFRKSPQPAKSGPSSQNPTPLHPNPQPPKTLDSQPLTYWYYLFGTTRHGPMSFEALKKSFYEDKITEETYVWNEDMSDWAKLKTLSIYNNLTT